MPSSPKPARCPAPTRLVKPGSTGNKIRILIVDDNKDTRENVSRLIAFESDMEVVGQAYNGITGLELADEYQPHIVLMDINMPDMDGITATREMSIRVSVLPGHHHLGAVRAGLHALGDAGRGPRLSDQAVQR